MKVILPTATVQPVTLNQGYKMTSWHDIGSFACRNERWANDEPLSFFNAESLETIDEEKFEGLDRTVKFVTELIDKEVKEVM